jgi:hypothetical protein
VEVPLLLQFSIALFTGMVAATLVPPVRRAIPKPVEVGLWVGLVTVCTLGIVGMADPHARELTSSALWGVDQIVNTAAGLMVGAVAGWMSDNRFAIATWLALVAGIDVLVLSLMRSMRKAQGWQPRVRLGEWMEMPSSTILAAQPAPSSDAVAELNRRLAASSAVVGAQAARSLGSFASWLRREVVPRGAQHVARATEASRVESRARMESLRDATSHLQFAARAWYAGAGAPVVSDVGAKAAGAIRRAAAAGKLGAASAQRGQVVDVQALISAQSIGWYGPLSAGAPLLPPPSEQDGAEPERSNRLAS